MSRQVTDSEVLPGKPVTLRLLAKLLNLSTATISLVLNDAPGARGIPQETRARVIEAASRFNYRPNFTARSLQNGRGRLVGVLVPELNDLYSTSVLQGLDEVFIEEGYFYLTACHLRKPDLIELYPNLLKGRSIEGFILIDTILTKDPGLPAVVVAGHKKIEGVTCVALNQRRAAELLVGHLYELGHRKIAFMRGGDHNSNSTERWECLMAVARQMGLNIPVELKVRTAGVDSAKSIGYEPVTILSNRRIEFTALVCFDDLAAIGAIRFLKHHGLQVPKDISVVGFDDIESAGYLNPRLTTIRQPLTEMGRIAAQTLLRRIRGQIPPSEEILVEPSLVIRESARSLRRARSSEKRRLD
jgi:LacI family transcriptional regulator